MNIKIVNLTQDLTNLTNSIECKLSTKLNTTFCVHDKNKDLISRELWNKGYFEDELLGYY